MKNDKAVNTKEQLLLQIGALVEEYEASTGLIAGVIVTPNANEENKICIWNGDTFENEDTHTLHATRETLTGVYDAETGVYRWFTRRTSWNFWSIIWRLREAWLVFTGRADVVLWPRKED